MAGIYDKSDTLVDLLEIPPVDSTLNLSFTDILFALGDADVGGVIGEPEPVEYTFPESKRGQDFYFRVANSEAFVYDETPEAVRAAEIEKNRDWQRVLHAIMGVDGVVFDKWKDENAKCYQAIYEMFIKTPLQGTEQVVDSMGGGLDKAKFMLDTVAGELQVQNIAECVGEKALPKFLSKISDYVNVLDRLASSLNVDVHFSDVLWAEKFVYFNVLGLGVSPLPPEIEQVMPLDGQVNMQWATPSGPTVTGYAILCDTEPGVGQGNCSIMKEIVASEDAGQAGYNFHDLENGTKYYFTVISRNAGGISAESEEFWATPGSPDECPGAPKDFRAYPGIGEISFRWDDKVGGIGSYTLYYSESPMGRGYQRVYGDIYEVAGIPSSPFSFSGLENGKGSHLFADLGRLSRRHGPRRRIGTDIRLLPFQPVLRNARWYNDAPAIEKRHQHGGYIADQGMPVVEPMDGRAGHRLDDSIQPDSRRRLLALFLLRLQARRQLRKGVLQC